MAFLQLCLRRLLFAAALVCLVKSLFFGATAVSVAGFFLCGGLWYGLAWRRARSLDSPRPR